MSTPSAPETDPTTIPRTPMVERYLTTKALGTSGESLYADACDVERNVGALVDDFLASVATFSSYDNRAQAFHDERPAPQAASGWPGALWRTNDVSARLHPSAVLAVNPARLAPSLDLSARYVDREVQPARTTGSNSHKRQQQVDPDLKLLTVDLLLASRTEDGSAVPVLGEIKTPSDVTAYHALIQVLAAAAQFATPAQAARLQRAYPEAGFAGESDPRVDAVIYAVDRHRCGAEGRNRPPSPRDLDLTAIAEPIARTFMAAEGIGECVRRLALVELGLVAGRIVADAKWVFEAATE